MITKTLGLALREERERKKLTIEDLSKILNLNTKTILHVEDGTKKIHFLAMGIMLKFYKKKIDHDIVKAYKAALKFVIERIKNYCEARGASYLLAPSNASIFEVFVGKMVDLGVLK